MTQQNFQNTVFVHKDKMYRFANRLLQDEQKAFDIVQDTLLKLWQIRDQLISINNIEAYAMRSIKNQCLNNQRHDKIVDTYKVSQMKTSDTYEYSTGNTKQLIIEMINQLPEKQKMVIHLKDIEEYDVSEIAEMLDMDSNAVRVNLMRARQKIKSQLEQIFDYEKRQLGRSGE